MSEIVIRPTGDVVSNPDQDPIMFGPQPEDVAGYSELLNIIDTDLQV